MEQKITEAFDGLFGFLKKDQQEGTNDTTQDTETQSPEETQKAEEIANELRWYRKMVEEGLITKEQYDRKERELLGK